ncbi:hypothetical protein AVEN_237744-1 [Araneus ventricosus]|uniref:Tesmin/TSO1-like CXC domain-containing protein n=1 Tax=Araneus ventricosus TaxID=182803 RepID=A0A4Y2S2Q1_ARAVE|nr:hypothetical protein AVEN_237744-1 [Araneus ventricosus]
MDCSQSPPTRNQLLQPFSLRYHCKCAKVCNLTCTCRKYGIKCSMICSHYKGQGCTNSLEDSIITNLAKQEAEIDIRMEEIILEVALEEEYQKLQVEESDSKQTDINDYD